MTSKKPVVCTAAHEDATNQLREWTELQKLATAVKPLERGAELRFDATQSAVVENLARREATCCAFLSITTSLDGDEVVLRIEADGTDAQTVVAALSGIESA